MAVPCGTSALDENSICTSAHTKEKHYMDNKPAKYVICKYANVGTWEAYIHTIWDKGCSNSQPSCPAEWYLKVFLEMRYAFNKVFGMDFRSEVHDIKANSATALWIL
jgi:hypothetical protein